MLSSCTKSIETYDEFSGRIRYSSKISNLEGQIGIEKVVLNWINPEDKIAKKIRIEYGDNLFIETESMVSTYTIKDLTSGGGYKFTVYTVDEYGNKSIGSDIFLVPYNKLYVDSFIDGVTTTKPTSQVEDDNLIVKWDNLLGNAFLRYTGVIDFSYTYNNETISGRLDNGNIDKEIISISDVSEPVSIDLEYTMYYYPIINNTLIMDTISKTEKIKVVVDYPKDNILEKIDHSKCVQLTNIPFDNTSQHNSDYSFYKMFDDNINSIWISARPDNDPIKGGNAQNNYEYPLSFSIDLGKETILSALEFTGWEDYSQAPKKFEIWGTNEILTGKPNSYWETTIPGEWQNDWKKLATCDTDNFNRPSIRYDINTEKQKVRYIRLLVHEIYKIEVQWGGVYIRIAIGEMNFYRQPGMISSIIY